MWSPDPFPFFEVGPFCCTCKDPCRDEPEIIVDPLTGRIGRRV
jgi:hypothetical protein